ncbi:MAG: thioesterase family protein [Trueperaceae bacterium]|nr:thioesterase family protein [Trueperaceae bacterium]
MDSLCTWRGEVKPDWIDYNGHLNDGYYAVAFSLASEGFLELAGVFKEYRERTNCTVYTVETHISYMRELKAGAPIRVTSQLVAYDAKRIHLYLEMFHDEENYLAATYETLLVHVDQSVVRVVAMPEEVAKKLEAIALQQQDLPKPKRLGRTILPIKAK